MKFEELFTQQGYFLLRQADLSKFVEAAELEKFQRNILFFRQQMRKFFERKDLERTLFKSEQPENLELTGYHAGYWNQGLFKDNYEGKKFPLEYYHSGNLYSNSRQRDNFLTPENGIDSSSKEIAGELPDEASYEIAKFLERYIYKPLALYLDSKVSFNLQPFSTLQVSSTYYRDQIVLDIHRDKAFIQIIVGYASGIRIQPNNSDIPQLINLDLGEMLVYTGLQFQNYFAEVPILANIEPLLHGVMADKDKRMSIISGTLLKV